MQLVVGIVVAVFLGFVQGQDLALAILREPEQHEVVATIGGVVRNIEMQYDATELKIQQHFVVVDRDDEQASLDKREC